MWAFYIREAVHKPDHWSPSPNAPQSGASTFQLSPIHVSLTNLDDIGLAGFVVINLLFSLSSSLTLSVDAVAPSALACRARVPNPLKRYLPIKGGNLDISLKMSHQTGIRCFKETMDEDLSHRMAGRNTWLTCVSWEYLVDLPIKNISKRTVTTWPHINEEHRTKSHTAL